MPKNRFKACLALSILKLLFVAMSLFAIEPARSYAQPPATNSTPSSERAENPFAIEYRSCDANGDGLLSEDEYVKRIGRELPVLRREFKVFDHDGNGRMSLAEFLTVPAGQPDDQRGTIPDPVVLLSEAKLAELSKLWKMWDQNSDDLLAPDEFKTAAIVSRIRGLEATGFDDWDLNRDGQVSRDEVARVLDIAYGVRIPSGELARSKIGQVIDWRMFRALNPDKNGKVSREDYIKALGGTNQKPDTWFPTIYAAGNERFGFAEFATSSHRTDPVRLFLDLDLDLNGRLTREELKSLPVGWGPSAKDWLPGFDDNGDGAYSLREFLLIPHVNLLATWHGAQDTNQDGRLSPEEFRFMPGPALAALSAEYFRRLDVNQDQLLSLSEWPFHTSHPEARFTLLDGDSDGQLTEAEFTAEGSLPAKQLSRDFKVFDADLDGRMSLAEFLNLPYWVPEDQRGPIADPVVLLAEKSLKELTRLWGEWDQDADALLTPKEFEIAEVGKCVRGLEQTTFKDWDLDRDQQVSREEAARVLEIAYGVRTPEGGLLRSKSGRVVDWRLFRKLTVDRDGFVNCDEYVQALGSLDDQAKKMWLSTTDQNRDGKFNYAEFATSNHRTDPVVTFLRLDADLNGRLTPDELEALTPDQMPVANCLFPGFDDDEDGGLSLREYQLTPLVNFLAHWESAQDTDSDGKLSPEEFRFYPGVALAALSRDYFRRLDVNEDQSLSLEEFPFVTDHRPPNEIYVQFADGRILKIAIPDYPIIFSPEISPDAKWIAVDGWKHGQNNVAAHLLIASIEKDEVRDLGIGCIPHWSADGRRIAYSKYGKGVFIRNFEGDAEEESIDPQGWAIEFSIDGLKTAYVKGGNNFVIHDVATDEKRLVFPEGQSPYRYIEHNFTWSPDSQQLVFKGHRPNGALDVGIVNATGGDPKLRVLCDAKDVASDFSWLAGGKRLMFPRNLAGTARTQIFEIDPNGDKPSVRYPTQPKDRNNIGVCWSRDGKTFVYMTMK